MDVLYWIRGQSWRFKPFVANRVGEIQALTDPEQWRYVPPKQNQANLLTRGRGVSALGVEGRWWRGASFLKQDPSEWSQTRIVKKNADVEVRKLCQEKEQRLEQKFVASITVDCLEAQRSSSWVQLIRTAAWVNRFIENCRLPTATRRQDTLQSDEVTSAGTQFIGQAQQEVFTQTCFR